MSSTMARNRRACATASIPLLWTCRRIEGQGAKRAKRGSGCRAGTRDHFCHGVAVPYSQQQHFAAVWKFENVVDAVGTRNLEESGAARIRTRGRTNTEQYAQFRNFLLGVVPQVFQDGRLF